MNTKRNKKVNAAVSVLRECGYEVALTPQIHHKDTKLVWGNLKYFKRGDFFKSSTAARLGIDMSPASPIIEERILKCAFTADAFRTVLELPVDITSCYRPIKLNRILESPDTSWHVVGWAFDSECYKLTTAEYCYRMYQWLVANDIDFDRLILEYPSATDKNAGWVHLSIAPNNRRELKIKRKGTRYLLLTPANLRKLAKV